VPISEQAAIQFSFSDNSGKVRVPSVAANNEHRPSKDRVAAIAEVNDRGLQFESSWIQRPPVQDPSFISRLNKERAVNLRLSRLKLDPWHWMDRYSRTLSKPHALYPLFMSCLRDALFYLNKGDVEMRRMELIDRGLDATEAARIPKPFFTQRGRCRRVIPQRIELAIRVQAVFEIFDGLTDNDGGSASRLFLDLHALGRLGRLRRGELAGDSFSQPPKQRLRHVMPTSKVEGDTCPRSKKVTR